MKKASCATRSLLFRLQNLFASAVYFSSNALLGAMEFIFRDLRKGGAPENILFFRTGSMGDMLCALPAFRAVKRHFPGSRTMLLTKEEKIFSLEPLTSLIGSDLFDEIIYYKSKDLRSIKRISVLLGLLRRKRVGRIFYLGQYDVGVLRLIRDMFFFYACGCRRLDGFSLNKHRIFRLPQRYLRVFDKESERLLKVVAGSGAFPQKADFALPISSRDRDYIDSLWPQDEASRGRNKIAFMTDAKFSVNRWPKENFLYLARGLIDKLNAFIVFVGGKEAATTSSEIKNSLGGNCLDLCGVLSFMQSAEVISRCTMLVSGDSGPLHMAGLLGIPAVGIFSARDYPNCWYPFGGNHRILRHDLECQVCLKSECDRMECIKSITADEVLASCKEIIGGR
ncbi:MAG TPA: glycosyltransferase family 9 protein [Candidatus Margulisiibacteriota bacterium]|nr:glycosyltransferase family 9 protein [Candidatus Margulisiibacteriota bacterium]